MDIVKVCKPDDWPRNNREINIEDIFNAATQFYLDPSYVNKEKLFALIDPTDINEINELGEVRICDYEIALINQIYQYGTLMNCVSLKAYLYGHIGRYTRFHIMLYKMPIAGADERLETSEFSGLVLPLKLFYFCCADFYLRKDRSFTESILAVTGKVFGDDSSDIKFKRAVAYSYNLMLHDLSFANSNVIFTYLEFSRAEIKRLVEMSAYINKKVGDKISESPLCGLIKLTLRQLILKSRNNYDTSRIYKSISTKNLKLALSNHQVWMSKIERLNDKREQKVIKGLFANKRWLAYDWAKKVEFKALENCFVCSFSKVPPNAKMRKKYGGNVLGYKTDRIANILAPVILIKNRPFFDQVAYYDIIYDENTAKDEINYLCELINLYELTNEEKSDFFNEIISYWYLSFKDKKWGPEQERRYQLFIFDDAYRDLVIENDFLKEKNTLYLFPDFFLSHDNDLKQTMKKLRLEKIYATATKSYNFCEECYQIDYNNVVNGEHKCPICGATNIIHTNI